MAWSVLGGRRLEPVLNVLIPIVGLAYMVFSAVVALTRGPWRCDPFWEWCASNTFRCHATAAGLENAPRLTLLVLYFSNHLNGGEGIWQVIKPRYTITFLMMVTSPRIGLIYGLGRYVRLCPGMVFLGLNFLGHCEYSRLVSADRQEAERRRLLRETARALGEVGEPSFEHTRRIATRVAHLLASATGLVDIVAAFNVCGLIALFDWLAASPVLSRCLPLSSPLQDNPAMRCFAFFVSNCFRPIVELLINFFAALSRLFRGAADDDASVFPGADEEEEGEAGPAVTISELGARFKDFLVAAAGRSDFPRAGWPKRVSIPQDPPDAPDAFICPITRMPMEQPAVAVPSGNSYERSALELWVERHGTDPLTKEPMDMNQVFPNRTLHSQISEWAESVRKRRKRRGEGEIVWADWALGHFGDEPSDDDDEDYVPEWDPSDAVSGEGASVGERESRTIEGENK